MDRICSGCAYTGEDCTHVSKEPLPKASSITIEDVKRLVLEKNQILLIKLPWDLTDYQMQAAIDSLRHSPLANSGKIFIYRGDLEFTVIEDRR